MSTEDVLIVTEEAPETEPVLEGDVVSPEDTPLLRQVIPHNDARSFKRVVNEMMKRRVGLMAVCLDCQDAQRGALCQYAKREDSGELIMACQCTMRILEGVVR